jgi:hypothetical protein
MYFKDKRQIGKTLFTGSILSFLVKIRLMYFKDKRQNRENIIYREYIVIFGENKINVFQR